MNIRDHKEYGPHLLQLSEEGIIVYRLRGQLDEPELIGMMEHQADWHLAQGFMLVLVDAQRSTGMSTPAFRAAQARKTNHTPRAIAVFGASFAIQTFADVLFRALRALSGGAMNFRFFKTEEECREWLESERPKLIARAQKLRESS